MHLQYITYAVIARGYADENRQWNDEQDFIFESHITRINMTFWTFAL